MAVILWIVAAGVAVGGAGLAAVSRYPGRRRRGLAATTAAVGLLLLLLGSDLAALAWLAVAGGTVLLPGLRRRSRAVVVAPARLALLAVPAVLLFAALYRVILQVRWAALPAGPAVPRTAEAGGRLLTADAVVLLGISLLLTVVLAVAARPPASRRRGETATRGGPGPGREDAP